MEHMEVTLVIDSVTLRLASQNISRSGQLSCRMLPGQRALKSLIPLTPSWDVATGRFLATLFFLPMVAQASSGESKRYFWKGWS